MRQAIVGMELADIQAALGVGHPPFRARQIYDAVYRQRIADLAAISNLPKPLRARLSDDLPLGLPEIERRYDSADGTVRFLLRLADGKTVETVWMPEDDRATICISSQIGCPVDCKFCLTALLGLERSLTAGEIVGQVLRVAGTFAVSRLNIVMMGQGEPPAHRSGRYRDFAPAHDAFDCRDHSQNRGARPRAGAPQAGDLAQCVH